MTKQIITVTSIYPPWTGLTLPQLLKRVEEALAENGPLSKLELSAGWDGDDPEIRIDIRREETDQEYEARLITEKKQKEYVDSLDRATYERLKRKFGNE